MAYEERQKRTSGFSFYKHIVTPLFGVFVGLYINLSNHCGNIEYTLNCVKGYSDELEKKLEENKDALQNARIADVNGDNQPDLILPFQYKNQAYIQTDNGLVYLDDYLKREIEAQQERRELEAEAETRKLWHDVRKKTDLYQKVADDIMKDALKKREEEILLLEIGFL